MNIKKIACCIDFSENAEDAFITALDLAEKYKAKLFYIHGDLLKIDGFLRSRHG
jgi:hypothetical protein